MLTPARLPGYSADRTWGPESPAILYEYENDQIQKRSTAESMFGLSGAMPGAIAYSGCRWPLLLLEAVMSKVNMSEYQSPNLPPSISSKLLSIMEQQAHWAFDSNARKKEKEA